MGYLWAARQPTLGKISTAMRNYEQQPSQSKQSQAKPSRAKSHMSSEAKPSYFVKGQAKWVKEICALPNHPLPCSAKAIFFPSYDKPSHAKKLYVLKW